MPWKTNVDSVVSHNLLIYKTHYVFFGLSQETEGAQLHIMQRLGYTLFHFMI